MIVNTPHPAKFSKPILEIVKRSMEENYFRGICLDPMAGQGGIHELADKYRLTVGVELEPEWAIQHPRTIQGDALRLDLCGFTDESVDGIFVSPSYGNRMADSFESTDGSKRHTYRHYLGRPPSEGSSAVMQWTNGRGGNAYREFHVKAWIESLRVLKDGGYFWLNVSNHIRKGEEQKVSEWHRDTLKLLGIDWIEEIAVETRRQRHGSNRELRLANEWVFVGRKRLRY